MKVDIVRLKTHYKIKTCAGSHVIEFSKVFGDAFLPNLSEKTTFRFFAEQTIAGVDFHIDNAFGSVKFIIFLVPDFTVIPPVNHGNYIRVLWLFG